jgi:predicted ATPase
MLESERAALHQEVAEAILQRLPSHVPGYDGMLAYHFGLAGDLERAEEHLDRAGEVASQLAASDEAVHFFSEAARSDMACRRRTQHLTG